MEVYAAVVDSIDQSVRRLRASLSELGQLENTIFVFTSDNGASREGGEFGTTEYYRTVSSVHDRDIEGEGPTQRDRDRIDLIGGPRLTTHYPRGWGMASNTPFRLFKSTTLAGGHQVPFIVSWPRGLGDRGAIRHQYAYVTDVLPTLIDLIGLDVPRAPGRADAGTMDGISLSSTLTDADAPTKHREQYYEMRGQRGYYRDGWEAVTIHPPGVPFEEDEWFLYHQASDITELNNVAGERPERVAELVDAWSRAAWANGVFPLDDGTLGMFASIEKPPRIEPVVLTPAHSTYSCWLAKNLIRSRGFTVKIQTAFTAGNQGILLAHGDQGGGYALYIENDDVTFAYNYFGELTAISGGAMQEGNAVELTLAMGAPGGGVYDMSLTVAGELRVSYSTLPMLGVLAPFEGIDVGIDRRSPVVWDLYERHGCFPYTGELRSVTYIPGQYAPDAFVRAATEGPSAAAKED
jgi:arylsulfatase